MNFQEFIFSYLGGNEYDFFILDLKYIANVDLTAVEVC